MHSMHFKWRRKGRPIEPDSQALSDHLGAFHTSSDLFLIGKSSGEKAWLSSQYQVQRWEDGSLGAPRGGIPNEPLQIGASERLMLHSSRRMAQVVCDKGGNKMRPLEIFGYNKATAVFSSDSSLIIAQMIQDGEMPDNTLLCVRKHSLSAGSEIELTSEDLVLTEYPDDTVPDYLQPAVKALFRKISDIHIHGPVYAMSEKPAAALV